SYMGCAAQLFFFAFFISTEYFLLTIMCYDRYVAICKPLHYGTLLGSRACAHMAAAAWATGFLNSLLHTVSTFSLPLCQGNALDQFFCEIPHILKLSCSHSGYLRELGLIVVSAYLVFCCFIFIVFSYVQIFRAVLRIPSQQGRHKAFSTCLPHLAVVSLFLSTAMFAYLKPPSSSSPSLDLALSVLYSVVPPALNPFIYSLRNQELKDALRKMMTTFMKFMGSRRRKARITPADVQAQPDTIPTQLTKPDVSTASTAAPAKCDTATSDHTTHWDTTSTDDESNCDSVLPGLTEEADATTMEGVASTDAAPVQRLADTPSLEFLEERVVSAEARLWDLGTWGCSRHLQSLGQVPLRPGSGTG
ncbi:olfactory receptor 14J1-like, partial [Pseudopipra pipra]|uniref:olfactory receptor 14J1-like n=1 Tax=Pseudopipra pipra TaxID=415032 RepID=UPI00313A3994